jgi:hypothetical protein
MRRKILQAAIPEAPPVEEVIASARIDLFDLSYLAAGGTRQRAALQVIEELGICRDLAEYTPALAGTIPLGIDIEGSDLDVICQARDLDVFAARVRELYSGRDGFRLACYPVRGVSSVVAGFNHDGWVFEVFAQAVPVAEQYACLHLLSEARLLELAGEAARISIREMKQQGLKTEPAFARYFQLPGDPYEALARLARASDEELRVVNGNF